MCLIILKETPTARIPDYILDNAETLNPDGFSVLYLDDGQLIKTMDYTQCVPLLDVDRPYAVHYRYATRGKVGSAYCHPYTIAPKTYLFSNGTVADLGSKDVCDTDVVAEYLGYIPKQYWDELLSMTETRFLIVDKKLTATTYGEWHERDGILYSKANCFSKNVGYNLKSWSYPTSYKNSISAADKSWWDDEDEEDFDDYEEWEVPAVTPVSDGNDWNGSTYLAVYGTLKEGEGNHYILNDSELIGCGETVNKFPMEDTGAYPIAYDNKGVGHNLQVEVYIVKDEHVQDAVDNLEGHPSWYKRQKTTIMLDDGQRLITWIYLQPKTYQPKDIKMIKHF
jgi:gamma-glutamylaminecyclotransferase